MPTRTIEIFVTNHHAGTLTTEPIPGSNREHLEFTYTPEWITSGYPISPELPLNRNRHRPTLGRTQFGAFQDAGPDRWGTRLIIERARRAGRPPHTLTDTDLLLMVPDETRQGALRFHTNGQFQDTSTGAANLIDLRDLAQIAQQLETGAGLDTATMLFLQTGTSPGGAQPKSVVRDTHGNLWLAKYPNATAPLDQGRWEHATATCATDAGITVAPNNIVPVDDYSAIFMTQRFDRTQNGERLPYLSCRSILQHTDNSRATPAYTDLAAAIRRWSNHPTADLHEWFRRAIFNAAVHNIDDHLRNFGMLRHKDGWRLAPAFDVNPLPGAIATTPLTPDGDLHFRDPAQLIPHAHEFALTEPEAQTIAREILSIARELPTYGRKAGVAADALTSPRWVKYREHADRLQAALPTPKTHQGGKVWVPPHLRNGEPVAGYWRRRN